MWHDALPPRGVRDAAIELLHAMVGVEAEALAYAPGIRGRVMAALIEHLLASFVSIATGELASVSQGGILQACDVVALYPGTAPSDPHTVCDGSFPSWRWQLAATLGLREHLTGACLRLHNC